MSELRLLIGLPASGKTTYCQNLIVPDSSWRRLNWDDMRKVRGLFDKKFNRTTEDIMQKESFELVEKLGQSGMNVAIDNTNLTESTRNKWKGVAQRAGMIYTEVNMNVTLEECIARDAKREGTAQVGRAVIERMALWAGLIKFPNQSVIVDIDGTIADLGHRRHFINLPVCLDCYGQCGVMIQAGDSEWFDKCGTCLGKGVTGKKDHDSFFACVSEDKPIENIMWLVRHLHETFDIWIVSGRSIDKAGKATVEWLAKHNILYQHIFMRQGGDHRPDTIVKQEILDRLPKDKIAYVLDDRSCVVDMWRKNGLTCLQVAKGDF